MGDLDSDELLPQSERESHLVINATTSRGSRSSSVGSFQSPIITIRGSRSGSISSLLAPSTQKIDQEDTPKSLCDYTAREKATLICLAISNMCGLMCGSILGPFFPSEATSRGVSSSVGGWIFGVYALVQCVTSPLFGRLVTIVGVKFQFIMGGFFGGSCCILFGLLDMVPYDNGPVVFVVLCFVVRIFMAVGGTACAMATFALTTHLFRESAASALSVLEIGSGLGLMLGPALGGVLYEHLGFKGPFLVVGGLVLLPLPLYYIVINPVEDDGPQVARHGMLIRKILSMPSVLFISLTIIVISMSGIILDPTLAPHLEQDLDFSPSQVGLSFLLVAGIYTVLSPFVGRLADVMPNNTPLIALGFMFSSISMFFLGPSPYSGLKDFKTVWLNLLSLVMVGVGGAFTIIPTYNKLLEISCKAGLEESLALHAIIGSIWNASFAFGEFVGPVLGGWLLDLVGFEYCMTGVSIADVLLLVMTLVFWTLENKKENQQEMYPDFNDRSHLLSNNT